MFHFLVSVSVISFFRRSCFETFYDLQDRDGLMECLLITEIADL